MYLYGTIIVLGIFVGLTVCERLTPIQKRSLLWGSAVWAIIGGVIGARLYHVLNYPKLYFLLPVSIFYLWNGGLGIFGAIIGSIAGLVLFLKRKGEQITSWLDVFAVGAPLAQSIGRLANYFNYELYGSPTSLPWGLFVPKEQRVTGYVGFARFHPLFLYELVLDFALFLFLYFFYTHGAKATTGKTACSYIIGYSTIRFFLEFLRIDPWRVLGVNVAQAVCVVLVTIAIVVLVTRASRSH